MPETAVSDTGPMLHLGEIGRLAELKQFDKIVISDVVRVELRRYAVLVDAEKALPDTLEVQRVRLSEITAQRSALSGFVLHRADLSVAALASRLAPDVVLTDDLGEPLRRQHSVPQQRTQETCPRTTGCTCRFSGA